MAGKAAVTNDPAALPRHRRNEPFSMNTNSGGMSLRLAFLGNSPDPKVGFPFPNGIAAFLLQIAQ